MYLEFNLQHELKITGIISVKKVGFNFWDLEFIFQIIFNNPCNSY